MLLSLMWMACAKHEVVEIPKIELSTEERQFWVEHPSWTGATVLPNEMRLDFELHFSTEGNLLTATMDIPIQNAEGLELSDLVVTNEKIDFVLKPPKQPKFAWAYYSFERVSFTEWDGTLTQVKRSFPTTVKAGERIGPNRPQTPTAPFSYKTTEIRVPTLDNAELAGTLTMPSPDTVQIDVVPLAIMITGSGPQDRDETIFEHKPFAVLADHLAKNGIASIRLDDRGVGESTGARSDITTLDLANDVLGVLKYVETLEPTFGQIGLLGHSEGGLIAAIVASQSEDVDFVVSLAGSGVSGLEILKQQTVDLANVSGEDADVLKQMYERAMTADANGSEEKDAFEDLLERQLSLQNQEMDAENKQVLIEQSIAIKHTSWMQTFMTLDPAEYWKGVNVPVLALNGSLDLQVAAQPNLSNIEMAIASGGNLQSTMLTMDGLNHLFQVAETGEISEYGQIEETMSPIVLDLISDWILQL